MSDEIAKAIKDAIEQMEVDAIEITLEVEDER